MNSDRKAWKTGMEAVHREAEGLLEVWVVLASDLPGLLIEGTRGTPEADWLLGGIFHVTSQIKAAPPERPALCGGCNKPLPISPAAFVAAVPANRSGGHLICMGICAQCGPDREAAHAAGAKALQELWPDSRSFTLTHHAAGNA